MIRENTSRRETSFRIRQRVTIRLRQQGPVLIGYLGITLIMTFPLITALDGHLIGLTNTDGYQKIWDTWWLEESLSHGFSPMITPYLFWPHGLDLAFNSNNFVASGIMLILKPLLGLVGAYNASILIGLFLAATSCFALVRYLTQDQKAAWLSGLVYAFTPYLVDHAGAHPDLAYIFPIPLLVLMLLLATEHGSFGWAVGAALMFILAGGALYTLIFTCFTLIPVGIYLLLRNRGWQNRHTLIPLALFAVLSAAFLVIRLGPAANHLDSFGYILNYKSPFEHQGSAALLSFITPSHHPLLESLLPSYRWNLYLGAIPLLLTVVVIVRREYFGESGVWLLMALMFLLMSLGPFLILNPADKPILTLPSYYLEQFPPYTAVRRADFFVSGLVLPLAVCTGYGMHWLLSLIHEKNGQAWRGWAAISAASLLILGEYWMGPFAMVPASVSEFYGTLGADPQGYAIIQLPMGRQISKYYLYTQTIHDKALIEGMTSRILPDSYRFIEENTLLSLWQDEAPLNCETIHAADLEQAVNELQTNQVRYVIVAQSSRADFASYFQTIQPIYEDSGLAAYSMESIMGAHWCQ